MFIHDRGHLLNYELMQRSGGLALIRPLFLASDKPATEGDERNQIVRTLEDANVKSGDILILGSVSGRAAAIVDLALEARERGIITVALTAMDYTSKTASQHPSGQRLFEVCDHIIDMHTEKGDAALKVEGVEHKVLPTSGFTSCVVAWCFSAQLIEHLMKRNIVPSVFLSVSMPQGEEHLEKTWARFRELGY